MAEWDGVLRQWKTVFGGELCFVLIRMTTRAHILLGIEFVPLSWFKQMFEQERFDPTVGRAFWGGGRTVYASIGFGEFG